MKQIVSERNSILIVQILILSFIFFIPLSISLKAIFLVISLICLLSLPFFRQHIAHAYGTLPGYLSLVFFLFIVLACSWSPAPWFMQWASLSKYIKLLYLPLLAAAFVHPSFRFNAINAYLLAMMGVCIISLLKAWGLILSTDAGAVVFNHIVTGLMMAFASYLAGVLAFQKKGWLRIVYITIMILTSYQILFINIGRTGYLAYVVLMSLLVVHHLPWKRACFVLFLFCGILGITYTQSPYLQVRIQESIHEFQDFSSDKNTSIGYRLQFHQYAKSLFTEHPLLGLGTGGFKYRFTQDNPVPSWGIAIADPHSQYWITLAEHGLAGLVLLFGFLGSLLITSLKLQETKAILWGILVLFCIGSLSDTLLCFSPIGYLLIAMSALCFGEFLQYLPNSDSLNRRPQRTLFRNRPVIT